MPLGSGTRLGPYEILSAIGAGGMGEVYRARDTRLKRDVAIKILPESLASGFDRLARFQREAEVLASLNHPNIAGIYGLEESDSTRALVMELVDGEDLSQRIARGPIPLDEALPIATQITEALEAAHEQGVIHRDLKPANVKVTPDGRVKVLDFGLAKLAESSGPSTSDASLSPTITSPALMTGVGVLLGTAAYMAPEQAKGRPADKRSDIWAFGCVLYEMLTGNRAFEGDDVSDTLAAVLRGAPDWTSLPGETPPLLKRLIARCLVKDPRERLRDIADARLEIAEMLHSPSSATMPAARVAGVRAVPLRVVVAIVAVTILLSVVGTWYAIPRASQPPVRKLDVIVPALDPMSIALSADGLRLAYVASNAGRSQLWTRSFDQAIARSLPGTDRALYPFWSPDGRALCFFADGKLKRIDVAAGTSQTLADAPSPRGGAWSPDGTIVFAGSNAGPLVRMAATGGKATPLAGIPGDGAARWPQFLPDGRHFLFFLFVGDAQHHGIYVGSLDGGTPLRVMDSETAGVFAAPRSLLVVEQGVLNVYPFDPDTGHINGQALPIAQPVGSNSGFGRAIVTASGASTLIYGSGTGTQRRQLTWRDRTGRMLGTVGEPDEADIPSISLSPDGRRIATSRTVQGNQDVWLIDVVRGVPTRLTFDAANDNAPIWTSDSQGVIFRSLRTGNYELLEKPASGAGEERQLALNPGVKIAYDASADGRMLLYGVAASATGADVWAVPLNGQDKPFPVVQTQFAEDAAQFAPDGRWVAYESNESGRIEVYVQAFPTPHGKWQISTNGGLYPRWRHDGRELFYVDLAGHLMATPISMNADQQSIDAGVPTPLFSPRLASGGVILNPGALARPVYAVAADGRFLLNEAADDAGRDTASLTAVLNWDAGLKR